MSNAEKPLYWFIQKPIAHNCPYRTNGAVFQTFEPTIVDNQFGEWIKVYDAKAYDAVVKERDEAIKGYETKCALYVKEKERADRAEHVLRELSGTDKTIAQLMLDRDALAAQLAEKTEIADRHYANYNESVHKIMRLERALTHVKDNIKTGHEVSLGEIRRLEGGE